MKTSNRNFPVRAINKLWNLSLQRLSLQRWMILSMISGVTSLWVIGSFPAKASGLRLIGSYSNGIYDDDAAAISTYDSLTQSVFVTNKSTNQIDILNISNPARPFLTQSISIKKLNSSLGNVNSVAFSNGILAAAVENQNTQAPGQVLFFNAAGEFLNSVEVGALPDMLTFTPQGNKLLVANEGEPSGDYQVDPEGSVSIIDLANGVTSLNQNQVTHVGFDNISLVGDVRIFGPNASVAQDLEPENITVAENGETAWVTLQENNAIAILDLIDGEFEQVVGLGFKDHSLAGNGLDASDKDGAIDITTYDNLYGIYQPDEIDSYQVDGKTYLITANEGDSRQYEFEDNNGEEKVSFNEETTVKELTLDPTAFPNAEELQAEEVLGNLEVTNTLGDPDGDGNFDRLFAFGGRSFSIWDEEGNLVWDSGDRLEQLIAREFPDFFNSNNDENNFDNRSDNKGPEPEGISIGMVDDRIWAFIGLERVGGVVSYDVTDPFNPFLVDYTNNRDFSIDFDLDAEGDPDPTPAQLAAVGDLGPEGLLFISTQDSPIDRPLLVVSNEVSGSTSIFAVEKVPEPNALLGLLAFTAFGWWSRQRKIKH